MTSPRATSASTPVVFAPVVFVMGAGVVGTALAAGLARAGVSVAGLHGRRAQPPGAASAVRGVPSTSGEIPPILSESDVIIISVRDERIPEVAERLVREKRLRPEQVVLHTSGAHPSGQALAVARPHVRAIGTLHPLVSFADPRAAAQEINDEVENVMKNVAFGVEGDDDARAIAARLAGALGGRPVYLDAESMPLYHAGAVIAANYLVALADIAQGLLVQAGVPRAEALPALVPLLGSVVQNLAQVGLPGALTGPVERGDVSSVEQHLRVLEQSAPDVLDLYRLMGRDVLRLARQKKELDPAAVARLEALFDVPKKC